MVLLQSAVHEGLASIMMFKAETLEEECKKPEKKSKQVALGESEQQDGINETESATQVKQDKKQETETKDIDTVDTTNGTTTTQGGEESTQASSTADGVAKSLIGKRGRPSASSSKYRGVSWFKANQVWKAQITVNGKYEYLGYFDNEEEAAWAYDVRALQVHGRSAQLNFPERFSEILAASLSGTPVGKSRTNKKNKRRVSGEDAVDSPRAVAQSFFGSSPPSPVHSTSPSLQDGLRAVAERLSLQMYLREQLQQQVQQHNQQQRMAGGQSGLMGDLLALLKKQATETSMQSHPQHFRTSSPTLHESPNFATSTLQKLLTRPASLLAPRSIGERPDPLSPVSLTSPASSSLSSPMAEGFDAFPSRTRPEHGSIVEAQVGRLAKALTRMVVESWGITMEVFAISLGTSADKVRAWLDEEGGYDRDADLSMQQKAIITLCRCSTALSLRDAAEEEAIARKALRECFRVLGYSAQYVHSKTGVELKTVENVLNGSTQQSADKTQITLSCTLLVYFLQLQLRGSGVDSLLGILARRASW